MKKLALVLVATAAASSAMAQVSVGTVNGLVTATVNDQLVNVRQGTSLPEGVMLDVAERASVEVTVQGCTTTIVGKKSVKVDSANCRALLAQGSGGGAGGGGGGGSNWGYYAAGGGIAALAIRNNNRNNNNNAPTVVNPVTPPPAVTQAPPPRTPSRAPSPSRS